jgi:uncharacterized protein YdhG (YjbR/CyaY superfamily)
VAAKRGAAVDEVDRYLDAVSEPERSALGNLRRIIRQVVPTAQERIAYPMPVFEHHGPLVGIAAKAGHLGSYIMSPAVVQAHAGRLREFDVGKGCVRFSPSKPLPDRLIRTIVAARVAENEARVTDASAHPPARRSR